MATAVVSASCAASRCGVRALQTSTSWLDVFMSAAASIFVVHDIAEERSWEARECLQLKGDRKRHNAPLAHNDNQRLCSSARQYILEH